LNSPRQSKIPGSSLFLVLPLLAAVGVAACDGDDDTVGSGGTGGSKGGTGGSTGGTGGSSAGTGGSSKGGKGGTGGSTGGTGGSKGGTGGTSGKAGTGGTTGGTGGSTGGTGGSTAGAAGAGEGGEAGSGAGQAGTGGSTGGTGGSTGGTGGTTAGASGEAGTGAGGETGGCPAQTPMSLYSFDTTVAGWEFYPSSTVGTISQSATEGNLAAGALSSVITLPSYNTGVTTQINFNSDWSCRTQLSAYIKLQTTGTDLLYLNGIGFAMQSAGYTIYSGSYFGIGTFTDGAWHKITLDLATIAPAPDLTNVNQIALSVNAEGSQPGGEPATPPDTTLLVDDIVIE